MRGLHIALRSTQFDQTKKMIVKYKKSVIEITNESDLDSAEFGQKFKKQYPVDLEHIIGISTVFKTRNSNN